MNQSEKQLEELFFKIKKMGWIKSKGNGYSGIGITFEKLIGKGKINITFKIGVFRSGKRYGEIHNHGTGFIINENDLLLLYDKL